MDVQQNGRKATRSSFTAIESCAVCGRVTFAGGWQDVGDGLRGYLAARAERQLICPHCSASSTPRPS
jgi:hypothetical protein